MTNKPTGRSLVANVSAALGGELIQAGLGVIIFFGLSFQLTEFDWGLYVSATATGLILGVVMNMGSMELLVRNVSRSGNLEAEWGKTITTQLLGGLFGLAIGLAVRPIFFAEMSLFASFAILSFNIFLFWAVETTVRVGQATDDLSIGTRGRLFFAIGRLFAVGIFALTGSDSLDTYTQLMLPLTIVGAGVAVIAASKTTATTPKLALPSQSRVIAGLPFVGTSGAQDLLASFDRPLLSANDFVVEAGQYGIADRVARIAGIPTMALVRATASDFFRAGERDTRETFQLATKYARPAVAYGFAASLALGFGSLLARGFVPDRLEPVLPMLTALAALSTLHAIQLFPANVLTGTDRQTTRLVPVSYTHLTLPTKRIV